MTAYQGRTGSTDFCLRCSALAAGRKPQTVKPQTRHISNKNRPIPSCLGMQSWEHVAFGIVNGIDLQTPEASTGSFMKNTTLWWCCDIELQKPKASANSCIVEFNPMVVLRYRIVKAKGLYHFMHRKIQHYDSFAVSICKSRGLAPMQSSWLVPRDLGIGI